MRNILRFIFHTTLEPLFAWSFGPAGWKIFVVCTSAGLDEAPRTAFSGKRLRRFMGRCEPDARENRPQRKAAEKDREPNCEAQSDDDKAA